MADMSDEIKRRLASKKKIASAEKLYELTGQDPAPSKDFCQLLVTVEGVIWRRWKISIRFISSHSSGPTPTEECNTYEEFVVNDNLQDEIERVFGKDTLERVQRLIAGHKDIFSKLANKIIFKIASYLDLSSIENLGKTNKQLHQICQSDQVWLKVYKEHHGEPSEDVIAVAKDLGWKRVFFMDHIQLRKESSRRQRSAGKMVAASHDTSPIFLTQQQPEV